MYTYDEFAIDFYFTSNTVAMSQQQPIHYGLTDEQVAVQRQRYGSNILNYETESGLRSAIRRIIKDPMIILLLLASSIYFISGKTGDGIFLSMAIIFQTSISLYQYTRSKRALEKLKDLSQPTSKVIRNGRTAQIRSESIVVGDTLLVEEGSLITADGAITQSHDFSVNESILTGESLPVLKTSSSKDNTVYSGTTVASGMAYVTATAIGNSTRLGAIGKSIANIQEEKTPLEKQIANFVRNMALAGAGVFLIVWIMNYWHSRELMTSLLQSLTLAMSILPEEIPVAFTTFMALGAWRLMKTGIIVKQMKTVETLGSATVICTDKTGTITENKMTLSALYVYDTDKILSNYHDLAPNEKDVVRLAMWASEPIPFDPMEKALHQCYERIEQQDERTHYKLIHEYPLAGRPPMMTHVFSNSQGNRIIASKGAPEALIKASQLSPTEQQRVEAAMTSMTDKGYRVLAVALGHWSGDAFPQKQQSLSFELKGLVGFYDPPKENIGVVLNDFYAAGIAVKIITGDNTATTTTIARQINFRGSEKAITGEELMKLSAPALASCVMTTNIFTRMFPEAKLRIINALKSSNQIVAMTGDGVNDGPALKAAHIGIAMGKKGTEIAKQAASLILLDDDLSNMVTAISMGRKIYTNLKKAIQYIISIHIPIILTVFIPLALGWIYPNIFSPIHIIFLEVIMGPTCSIIYENEPLEKNTMLQKPRPFTNTFFNSKELALSIIQGLCITAGTIFLYQYALANQYPEALTRTMVFTGLISANIFLTLINRSFYYSILTTIRYKNNMVLIIITITICIVALNLYFPPMTRFFEFESLNLPNLLICITVGFLSVVWFELVKWINRKRSTPKV